MTANHALSFPVMAPDQGRLISFEAVDSAGKDTVALGVVKWFEKRGLRTFDFDAHGFRVPIPEEIDLLKISEPGYWGIGRAVRDEIRKDPGFGPRYTAEAYALDREALYRRVVIPFLSAKPGRVVIQIRGLMSTLAYQPIQAERCGERLTIEELLAMRGNELELSRRPDVIFLLTVSEETRLKRQAGRSEDEQEDIFAEREFQNRVAKAYMSPEVQSPFRKLDSKIIEVVAEGTPEQVTAKCMAHLAIYMPQAAR